MKTRKIIFGLLAVGIFGLFLPKALAAEPQEKTGAMVVRMGIKALNLHGAEVTELDVSGCTVLEKLRNVTADTVKIHGQSMDSLGLSGGRIKVLDVSGCTSLVSLNCNGNQLSSLDVSGCTALEELDCRHNQLSSLGVSANTALTGLYCSSNQLTSLDVSNNTALEWLYCSSNQLRSLDVSNNKELEVLYCSANSLDSLDVKGCESLRMLICWGNRLKRLDLGTCRHLDTLGCESNSLERLNLNGLSSLKWLYCGGNNLEDVDLSGCAALKTLSCKNNRLGSLDVSANTALVELNCSNNQLRSLVTSASGYRRLHRLYCGYNHIPLSMLCSVNSLMIAGTGFVFSVEPQSDDTVLLVGSTLDLSSERDLWSGPSPRISTYRVFDKDGQEVSAGVFSENGFVFRFNEKIDCWLEIKNDFPNFAYTPNGAIFTWHISVEELPVQYFDVRVKSGNTAWGTATVTGNGRYEEGTEVTITAKAKEEYHFVNWTKKDGTVFSTEAVHTFTITENLDLTANFESGAGNGDREEDNFYVYAQEKTIYLSREAGAVQVYNAAGICVYSGRATVIPVRYGGLYVVRANGRACKVVVM